MILTNKIIKRIKNNSKKIVSMSLVACTTFTSLFCYTNAVEYKNKGYIIKNGLKYTAFAGATLVATGCLLGKINNKKINNNNNINENHIKSILDKIAKEDFSVLNIDKFVSRNISEGGVKIILSCDADIVERDLECGETVVLLGSLFPEDEELICMEKLEKSLLNFTKLISLQKKYPDRMIILKQSLEINKPLLQRLCASNMCSVEVCTWIEKFLRTLPLACEIKNNISGKKYFFSCSGIRKSSKEKFKNKSSEEINNNITENDVISCDLEQEFEYFSSDYNFAKELGYEKIYSCYIP